MSLTGEQPHDCDASLVNFLKDESSEMSLLFNSVLTRLSHWQFQGDVSIVQALRFP